MMTFTYSHKGIGKTVKQRPILAVSFPGPIPAFLNVAHATIGKKLPFLPGGEWVKVAKERG